MIHRSHAVVALVQGAAADADGVTGVGPEADGRTGPRIASDAIVSRATRMSRGVRGRLTSYYTMAAELAFGYSTRNARTGSIRVARRAGTYAATTATPISSPHAPKSAIGSVGLTS